jgi:NAD(P)-dependent dehydrogenase (short-subunit alcohol dehydrogenase family)
MQISNSSFIVSGGASGLGEGTVRFLRTRDAKVLIVDRDSGRGEALAAELGSGTAFQCADVTNDGDGKACVVKALTLFGGLQGLVNCAGVAAAEKVLGKHGPHSLENFTRVIQVNLIGSFNLLRHAADAMSRGEPNASGERGVIVNTASAAAFEGQIGQAAYAASKGGIVSLTLPVARELARSGIRVCAISPGLFYTPMMASLPTEVQQSLGQSVPFPSRLGRPDEFAALVGHIVENEMLNGETLRLDGALRLAAR